MATIEKMEDMREEWFRRHIDIVKTRNGYAVRPPYSFQRDDNAYAFEGDEFAFETFTSLVEWMKANIGNDQPSGWRKV